MIKQLICLLCLVAAMPACNGPRNIPDDKLIAITREIFIANAYRESAYSKFPTTDTIDIYTPIFKKYGYKPADLSYTINNLSRRKSVRFTDILEEVTRELAVEDSILKARIALRNLVERRTVDRYKRIVFSDSTRRFSHLSDPNKPDVSIPVQKGRYQIEFIYALDTSSRNPSVRYTHYVTDTTDSASRMNYLFRSYNKGTQSKEIFSIEVTDPNMNELRITLASSVALREKRIALRIDSMKITHTLPLQDATDSLVREIFRFRPAIPEFKLPQTGTNVTDKKKIIGILYPDTTGIAARRDTLVRR